jgi:hypothetical protein
VIALPFFLLAPGMLGVAAVHANIAGSTGAGIDAAADDGSPAPCIWSCPVAMVP